MERKTPDKLISFILVVALVISSSFAAIKAEAKYSETLNDYTSSVAGNFFFRTNYLKDEVNDAEQNVGSFNGLHYDFTIDVYNYENSLNFNDEDTDVYYYFTAEVYRLSGGAFVALPDGSTRITISYGNQTTATAISKAVGDNVVGTYYIGNGTPQYYYDPVAGSFTTGTKAAYVAYLPGMSTFDRDGGTQKVKINMDINQGTLANNEAAYLVVNAYSIPSSLLDASSRYKYTYSESVESGGSTIYVQHERYENYFSYVSNKYDASTGAVSLYTEEDCPVSERGVFYVPLKLTLTLSVLNSQAILVQDVSQDTGSYAVKYTLRVVASDSGTVNAMVCFNPNKLEYEGDTYPITQEIRDTYKAENGSDIPSTLTQYIWMDVNEGGAEYEWFHKHNMNDTIVAGEDLQFILQ